MKTLPSHLFKGRLNRRNYLLGVFIYFLLLVLFFFIEAVFHYSDSLYSSFANKIFASIYILIAVIFFESINIRRFHDIGLSGWYFIEGQWLGIYIREGDKKENKYGKPPPSKIDLKGLFGFSQNSPTKPNTSPSESSTSYNGNCQDISRG